MWFYARILRYQEWERSYLTTKARRLVDATKEGEARIHDAEGAAATIMRRTRVQAKLAQTVEVAPYVKGRFEMAQPLPVVEVLRVGEVREEEAEVLEYVIGAMREETFKGLMEVMD